MHYYCYHYNFKQNAEVPTPIPLHPVLLLSLCVDEHFTKMWLWYVSVTPPPPPLCKYFVLCTLLCKSLSSPFFLCMCHSPPYLDLKISCD